MDTFYSSIIESVRTKQLLAGAVGFLKVTDPSNKRVKNCIGIIINERTVLTLAQNVYQNSTSSFFSQIKFEIPNQGQAYHVLEAFLVNPTSSSKIQFGDIIEYAILKLDRTIVEDISTISNIFGQHCNYQQNIQLKQMQQKCCLLEGQLKKANLRIQNLTKKTKEMREKLQQLWLHQLRLGDGLLSQESFQNADYALSACFELEEYLYGKDSLSSVETLEKLALTNQSLSYISCINYYEKIINICDKHDQLEDQSYANAHFKLGCKYSNQKWNDQAINYLEMALHLNSEVDQEKQRECARELAKILPTKETKKLEQKYDLWQ